MSDIHRAIDPPLTSPLAGLADEGLDDSRVQQLQAQYAQRVTCPAGCGLTGRPVDGGELPAVVPDRAGQEWVYSHQAMVCTVCSRRWAAATPST